MVIMKADDLRPGQPVTVEVRNKSKDAIVRRVPPYTETVMGEEHEVTDKVLVEYPSTSIDDNTFFGNIQEAIPLEDISRR